MTDPLVTIKAFRKAEIPWLSLGLKVIVAEGYRGFRIDSLSKELGISRTSFYHLFKSKQNYFIRLAEFWSYSGTYKYIEQLDQVKDPKNKLYEMIRLISRDRIELLAWISLLEFSKDYIEVQDLLRKVEKARVEFVSGILSNMGFSEEVSRVKASVLMYYYSGWLILKQANNKIHVISNEEINELLCSIDIL